MDEQSTDAEFDEASLLQSVSHGAVLSIGGVGLQKVFLFLTNLILTAGLSVSLYGVYAFGWRIVRLLTYLAPFGTPTTLVRMLPEYRDEPARQNRILGLAYGTAFVATIALAAAVFVSADRINEATLDHHMFPLVLRLFALLLPFEGFTRMLGFLFRALERIEYQVLLVRVIRPGLRLLAAGVALAFGYSVVGVVGALVVAAILASLVAFWLTHTHGRPSSRDRRDDETKQSRSTTTPSPTPSRKSGSCFGTASTCFSSAGS